ncbi:hypothetical protein CC78DRAFT_570008 [Lojkania enalia]|uniref:Uncharacterized protein n=1 Tax=Lojkania enalia TaxID=147567 RepID=A0A9P4K3Q7_9PLEO|nr:hypothetical protein CC78DRAFT_570008 [Didymosphaeria enalia]
MKFITVSTALFVAAVSGAPVENQIPPNIEVDLKVLPAFTPVIKGAPFVSTPGEEVKRDVADLSKRATLTVDIWIDANRAGRHEGLITDTQRCYNLGNGWNDEISSLSVPNGFGCIFYRDNGCSNNDYRLTVPGGNYIANLQTYNFNDIISSYLCYN